ncbi:LCP family protein [Limosilactobacillus fermentum]|uniref:LCP family protein n=1 Tax=Limosilactobacillus fermentum TaxID=1613 RepID=UPI00062CFC07|nr:LCP family protein [Limosilactobacillus fermentum]KLD51900.1 transcriptional regulator [Limosilactobacillus fermentum]WEB67115.1 LCP family protein [Limosilactobacillus fermentum]
MDSEELQHRSSQHQHHHHHHHHHRRRWLRWLWILVGLVVVVALFFAGMAWRNVRVATNSMYSPSGVVKSRNLSKLLAAKKPINILLLGTDTGALGRSYKGRTDTIMMMSVNPQTKKTTIVSIPRDMEVTLPDYSDESPAKLNAAYTYGGVKETIKTLKEYYNVPIDGYVLVNMGGLEKAINQVGGVTVKSPLTFSYEGYSFEKGKTYTMKGAQALAFSRMRHEDPNGDYGRQERQRLVIMALLKKSASYKSILNQSFLNDIADETQTDFTLNNMMSVALHYRSAGQSVTSDHAQGTSQTVSGEDFEVVSTTERQRVSNELRTTLGLKQVTVKTESN